MDQIVLKRTNSADPHFQSLIKQLDADLRLRNGDEMDEYDQHNVIAPIDTVVIAYIDNQPTACGCFKKHNETTIEIKRMFVAPQARGKVSAVRYWQSWKPGRILWASGMLFWKPVAGR